MIHKRDLNVYFDASAHAWVCELNTVSGWVVQGYYPTRQAALAMQ